MQKRPKVGEILLRAGVIDQFQLKAALGEQTRWGQRLGHTLIKLGFLEERDLVRALASQLDLPVATLEGKRIHQDVLDLVPSDVAERNMVIPLFVKKEGVTQNLFLGMEDPSNLEVLDDLCFRTGMQVKPVMVSPSELCEAIDRYYRRPTINAPKSKDAPETNASPPTPKLAEPIHFPANEESAATAVTADASGAKQVGAAPRVVISDGTEELAKHWKGAPQGTDASETTQPDVAAASSAPPPVTARPVIPSPAAPSAPAAKAAPSAKPAPSAPAAKPAPSAKPAPPAPAAKAAPSAKPAPPAPAAKAAPSAKPAPPAPAAISPPTSVRPAATSTAPRPAAEPAEPRTAISSDDLRSATRPDPYAVKTRILLHALAQLLIEKGVMTRDEFHARVRDLQTSGDEED